MRKRRRRRNYTRLIVLGLAIFCLATAIFTYRFFFGALKPVAAPQEGRLYSDTAVNILLLGIDHRADDVGRSDTLAVLTIDMANDRAALLSVPRDTRVAIEGSGTDKINHAFAFGGHELSKKTVEDLLLAPIDHFVALDVDAFVEIIDVLGGVDIDVERPMHYEDPWDDRGGLVIDFAPGLQHLDGKKSMEYVRYRDEEGDLGRIGRQQNFARELLRQTNAWTVAKNLPSLLGIASRSITTDLSVSERCRLALFIAKLGKDDLTSGMLAGRPAYLDTISYWLPDIKIARQQMAAQMVAEASPSFLAAAAQAAADYEAALPKGLAVKEKVPRPAAKIEPKAPDKADNAGKTGGSPAAKTEVAAKDTAKDKEKEIALRVEQGQTARLDRRAEDRLDVQTENAKKDEAAKKSPAEKKGSLRVVIVNSSGIDGAGARAAAILRGKGFDVAAPTTGKNHLEHTRIVAADENVRHFYGMPFPCVIIGGGDSGETFVNIGADFNQ